MCATKWFKVSSLASTTQPLHSEDTESETERESDRERERVRQRESDRERERDRQLLVLCTATQTGGQGLHDVRATDAHDEVGDHVAGARGHCVSYTTSESGV